MLFWWILVEAFFIAFFVYGYIIYKRRLKNGAHPPRKRGADKQ
jgi:hypothetical protein